MISELKISHVPMSNTFPGQIQLEHPVRPLRVVQAEIAVLLSSRLNLSSPLTRTTSAIFITQTRREKKTLADQEVKNSAFLSWTDHAG